MSVTAADIMSQPVITVLPQTGVPEIVRLLASRRIGAVPVCRPDGTLAGIVSEEDVLEPFRRSVLQKRDQWLNLLAEGETLSAEFLDHIRVDHRVASDIMVRDVTTADEQTTLPELAEKLLDRKVRRLPIVRNGRVVGIVSRTDLVRALARAPAMQD